MEKEDKILISNVIDKYNRFKKTGKDICTNFLNLREFKIISNYLDKMHIPYNTYRVNDECEKVIIYFGDYLDYVTIYKFKNNNFSHKDVLGTLFSIGYTPGIIGDIFINDDYCYITNLSRLNDFLESNLVLIKNSYIELTKTNEIKLNPNRYIDLRIVIPSYRIDVLVSKLSHVSRDTASKLIRDKMILLNYEEVTSTNKIACIGDVISIRKVGKFRLESELSKSRKDNYFIEVKKYN